MLEEYQQDVLYLHMFIRAYTRYVPNLSPFAIKVETWLRASNIKYEVVENPSDKLSKSMGFIPYLIYNGQEISDSTSIIEFIAKLKGLAIDDGLSNEQKAVSRGFIRMIDEGFFWTYVLHRYYYDPETFAKYFQKRHGMTKEVLGKHFKDRAEGHGVGRRSVEEINDIAEKDIQALSDYLGDKQFLHGDKISMVDCTVFGHLCQIVYVPFPYPQMAYITTQCRNLLPYLDRIRNFCWPDWDKIVKSEPFDG